MHRRTHVAIAATTALLTGCANPVLDIRGPGWAVSDSRPVDHEPTTMAESMQKLNHLRALYYEAIRGQRAASIATTNGLVLLGVGTLGLTYGGASRAWIVGTGVAGGTAYGLSRAQLDARQLELWSQGINALDCARRASLPLDLGLAQDTDLRTAIDRLAEAGLLAQGRATQVASDLAALGPQAANQASVEEALAAAAAAITASEATVASGRSLLNASRGRELSIMVDQIGAQVTRATDDIGIDPSSVKTILSSIGSYGSIFVPGVDAVLSAAQEKTQTALIQHHAAVVGVPAKAAAPAAPVDPRLTALETDLKSLGEAQQTLVARQAVVRSLVAGVDATAVSAALKSCKVAGIAARPTLLPATLIFTERKADARGVSIAGGTPPYEVALLDPAAADSVAVIFKGKDWNTFEVRTGTAAAAGSYTVLVRDSAASQNIVALPVTVKAAGAPTALPPPPPPPPPVEKLVVPVVPAKTAPAAVTATAPPVALAASAAQIAPGVAPASASVPADVRELWNKLSTTWRAAPPIVMPGGTVKIVSVDPTAAGVRVRPECSPKFDLAPAQLMLKDALARIDNTTYNQLLAARGVDRRASQITLLPAPSCTK